MLFYARNPRLTTGACKEKATHDTSGHPDRSAQDTH